MLHSLYVVNEVALGQVFLDSFRFLLPVNTLPVLRSYIQQNLVNKGPFEATVSR
jgi:hypothetical protein